MLAKTIKASDMHNRWCTQVENLLWALSSSVDEEFLRRNVLISSCNIGIKHCSVVAMDLCSSVSCDELELRVTIRQMIAQIL